jgi:DNA polymerase III alpha subunit
MHLDKFNRSVFDSNDLITLIYQGRSNEFAKLVVDLDEEIEKFQTLSNITFNQQDSVEDLANQSNWIMPDEYKNLNIEEYILSLAPPWDPDDSRVKMELEEFRSRNMLDLLRWLKYFVDTCKDNNIVWGVGRGSSVASYVLFLLGVHKINSIKYNLDFSEFMR